MGLSDQGKIVRRGALAGGVQVVGDPLEDIFGRLWPEGEAEGDCGRGAWMLGGDDSERAGCKRRRQGLLCRVGGSRHALVCSEESKCFGQRRPRDFPCGTCRDNRTASAKASGRWLAGATFGSSEFKRLSMQIMRLAASPAELLRIKSTTTEPRTKAATCAYEFDRSELHRCGRTPDSCVR